MSWKNFPYPSADSLWRRSRPSKHQGVSRVFDRVLARDQVSFFGNVEVGRDVRLDELISLYDAVVLATGAARDRRLGIPGEDLPGVIGSGSFVGWYNGRPHAQAPVVRDVQSAVIIGNGNVAIDVARILAKGPEELAGSDVSGQVAAWLAAQPLQTSTSSAVAARRKPGSRTTSSPSSAHCSGRNLSSAIRQLSPEIRPSSKHCAVLPRVIPRDAPVTINFHFNLTPTAFVGDGNFKKCSFGRRAARR
jgi:NADPH-dependent glutamate synthase beta subunit-like oxidoreductase